MNKTSTPRNEFVLGSLIIIAAAVLYYFTVLPYQSSPEGHLGQIILFGWISYAFFIGGCAILVHAWATRNDPSETSS